jgi:hypothetical protein
MRRNSLRALRTLAFMVLAPAPIAAQAPAMSGIVRHTQSGNPLECLHVSLADSLGHSVAHTVTDAKGTFVIVAPDTGTFRVRFSVPGLEAIQGPLLRLTSGQMLEQLYPVSFDDQVALDLDRRPIEPGAEAGEWHSAKPTGGTMPGYGGRPITAGEAAYSRTQGFDQQRIAAEFIVDADGRPRSSSWRTIASTNPRTMQNGRSMLLKHRYEPARIGDQPVCELQIQEVRSWRMSQPVRVPGTPDNRNPVVVE